MPRPPSPPPPARRHGDRRQQQARRERAIALLAKRHIARQFLLEIKLCGLNKRAMAARMGTSPAALNRLLDPRDTALTLATLASAAAVLGLRLKIEVTRPPATWCRGPTSCR